MKNDNAISENTPEELRMIRFTHLTQSERDEIFILIEREYTQAEIAKSLGRAQSEISYEINRNKTKGIYDPKKAHLKARVRRRDASFRGKKIVEKDISRKFIEEALIKGHSPESISGRLKEKEKDMPNISGDTIERFRKSSYGRLLDLPWKKQKYRKHLPRRGKLDGRKFIEKRPMQANKRMRMGDMEGDFIVSGKSGKGVLLVVVCRKSRYASLENIYPVTVDNVHRAFLKIQKRFPEMKTLTLDNDILFQMHKVLEKLLNVKIYFCHPYHSWEKGSVENANRYIRRFLPKGTDLSRVSNKEIQEIEQYLNKRWLKCLTYASPKEVLEEYRKKKEKKKTKKSARALSEGERKISN